MFKEISDEADLLTTDKLKHFWEFVTTTRRTRSLAQRLSKDMRGSWLTPELAIQRVHSWGSKCVRVLCVLSRNEMHRERLEEFFLRDSMDMDGKLLKVKDKLDAEHRYIVKIPFGAGLDSLVAHESRVLEALAKVDGVPRLASRLLFRDVGVRAAVYHFIDAPSLQEDLEKGQLLELDDVPKLAAFLLQTLTAAHKAGWMHTELTPKHVLRDVEDNMVLCGWARAVPLAAAAPERPLGGDGLGLVEAFLQARADDTAAPDPEEDAQPPAPASLFSAPEQWLGLFVGRRLETPATDAYRAASLLLVAMVGHGPLGSPGNPVAPAIESDVAALRGLCSEEAMRRAEASSSDGAQPSPRRAAAEARFLEGLQRLMQTPWQPPDTLEPELAAWLVRALARERCDRPQAPAACLEQLDEAWSQYEHRMLDQRRKASLVAPATPGRKASGSSRRSSKNNGGKIVFEPPPELQDMTVM